MTSIDTEDRPSGWRLIHFQAMTVWGFTMTDADRQPLQNRVSRTYRTIRAT